MKIHLTLDTSRLQPCDGAVLRALANAVGQPDGLQISSGKTDLDCPNINVYTVPDKVDAARENLNAVDGATVDVTDATTGREIQPEPPKEEKPKRRRGRPKKQKPEEKPQPTVDVETLDVSVSDTSIDDALSVLDPEPAKPAESPTDSITAVRERMVTLAQKYGADGMKRYSKILKEATGETALSKIPQDKFQAVLAALDAEIESPGETVADTEDTGVDY